MSIELLFSLFMIFGIVTLIAGWREHWSEFGVLLFVTFISGMGFLYRLMG